MVTLAMVAAGGEAGIPSGEFRWSYGAPVLEARAAGGWDWLSVKDPSIVRYEDKWHLFCTVRGPKRSHAIVYLNFADFGDANKAPRHILACHPAYFCAPQVFYFTPQQKWYLICQAADFPLVEKELAIALRVVVIDVSFFKRADVHAHQPELAVTDEGVPVLKVGISLPQ
jgi:hypothetical protein